MPRIENVKCEWKIFLMRIIIRLYKINLRSLYTNRFGFCTRTSAPTIFLNVLK